MLSVIPSQSVEHAVGSSSAVIALTMTTTSPIGVSRYLLTSNVGLWCAQGSAPVAAPSSGSMYVPPNTPVLIDGANGASLAVVQDATAGKCSLTPVVQ
jgi:hypothetical protein